MADDLEQVNIEGSVDAPGTPRMIAKALTCTGAQVHLSHWEILQKASISTQLLLLATPLLISDPALLATTNNTAATI